MLKKLNVARSVVLRSLSLLSLFLVYFYQKTFSFFLGGRCRFEPSCSHYAVEAFKSKSFSEAILLVFKRILKCHPWGPHGYDPIPCCDVKYKEAS